RPRRRERRPRAGGDRAVARRPDGPADRTPAGARHPRGPRRRGRRQARLRARRGGGVTSTVGRLLALADLPRGRLALALGSAVLALALGVALPATAGYLISRAAEQPPILSLTTIIVVVRFLALARPLTRYLHLLSSPDPA